MVFKREWESNIFLTDELADSKWKRLLANPGKIIPSSQADLAPSPRNQIMLSSTNL